MPMEYRRVGDSGLKVSPLCLGVMMFGGPTDAAEAGRIVGAARDAGVNFIDTANAYAGGESERITGALVKGDRDAWVIATKLGNPFGPGVNQRGTGRKAIRDALSGSLKRLGTDYVDILYLHVDDATTPLAETVDALGREIADGRVLYFGVSNFSGWRIAEIVHTCERMGVPQPVICQPNYSAVNRLPEVEILPACGRFGLGVANFSPLARGILTGKYTAGGPPPPGSRAARKDQRMLEAEFRPESMAVAEKMVERARLRNLSPVQFATLWCLNNRLVTSVIAGPRTLDQWQDYLGIAGRSWHPEDEAFVNGLVSPGHMSTHGFTDPRYPVAGRVVA